RRPERISQSSFGFGGLDRQATKSAITTTRHPIPAIEWKLLEFSVVIARTPSSAPGRLPHFATWYPCLLKPSSEFQREIPSQRTASPGQPAPHSVANHGRDSRHA